MQKIFLPYNKVRNDAIKLAHKIYSDGFIPDVIYVSLRGGSDLGNVISEYFKLAEVKSEAESKKTKKTLFAALVAHSYTGMEITSKVIVDGWTYPPEKLKSTDKILLVDDIFDTGNTVNDLVKILLDTGIPRSNIKVAVHDYKYVTYKETQLPIQPDYWCVRYEITKPDDDIWIHYLSHELFGLQDEELKKYYYSEDSELEDILEPLLK